MKDSTVFSKRKSFLKKCCEKILFFKNQVDESFFCGILSELSIPFHHPRKSMESDIRILKIASFSFGGDGVALLPDGRVCFVRGGIPGDVVEAEILVLKKNFARAAIRAIRKKSDQRTTSFCPLREQKPPCPGCVYAETEADFELQAKQRQYEDFLTRGRPEPLCRFEPPVPSPSRTGYRSRISLSCEDGQAGYRADDNRTLIPVKTCALARPEINKVLSELEIPEDAKRLRIRWTKNDGTIVRFDRTKKSISHSPGKVRLTEDLDEYGTFLTPPDSFFQVNMPVAKELISSVLNHIEKRQPQYMFDLFCGSGFFSAAALRRFPDLCIEGVELDPDAVRAAKDNVTRLAPGSRGRFLCLNAAKFDPGRTDARPETTLVLLDPPRTGIPGELAETLKNWGPAAILYVSCAPDMLRRDIDRLGNGYIVREGRLFDMFPGTAHFESITLLEKI